MRCMSIGAKDLRAVVLNAAWVDFQPHAAPMHTPRQYASRRYGAVLPRVSMPLLCFHALSSSVIGRDLSSLE